MNLFASRKGLIVLVGAFFFMGSPTARMRGQEQSSAPETSQANLISFTEAKILVYLLPQVAEIRRKGSGVGIEEEEAAGWDAKNFYRIWVVNFSISNIDPKTIGIFSVNKHTGDIWQDDPRPKPIKITGTDLEGIQSLLRDDHGIDAQTMRQFQSLNPSLAKDAK